MTRNTKTLMKLAPLVALLGLTVACDSDDDDNDNDNNAPTDDGTAAFVAKETDGQWYVCDPSLTTAASSSAWSSITDPQNGQETYCVRKCPATGTVANEEKPGWGVDSALENTPCLMTETEENSLALVPIYAPNRVVVDENADVNLIIPNHADGYLQIRCRRQKKDGDIFVNDGAWISYSLPTGPGPNGTVRIFPEGTIGLYREITNTDNPSVVYDPGTWSVDGRALSMTVTPFSSDPIEIKLHYPNTHSEIVTSENGSQNTVFEWYETSEKRIYCS